MSDDENSGDSGQSAAEAAEDSPFVSTSHTSQKGDFSEDANENSKTDANSSDE